VDTERNHLGSLLIDRLAFVQLYHVLHTTTLLVTHIDFVNVSRYAPHRSKTCRPG
jgi:hypothetical protein